MAAGAVENPSGVATPPKLDSARPVSPAGRIPKLQCARPVSVTSRLEFLLQTLAVDARAVMDGAVLSSSSHDVRSSSVRSTLPKKKSNSLKNSLTCTDSLTYSLELH